MADGKPGRPRHKPTDKTRAEVAALASFGTNQDDIAAFIGIERNCLARYYRAELRTGLIRANAMVARSLFQQATQQNNVTAMIFWLKTRARWRETNHLDISSEDGSMTPPRVIEVIGGGSGKG